jgi:hypothetical protein
LLAKLLVGDHFRQKSDAREGDLYGASFSVARHH